jgi:acyl dehydratase
MPEERIRRTAGVILNLNARDLLGRSAGPQIFHWKDSDYLLYALSLGLAEDAGREAVLPFVYEAALKVVPTFPTVVAWITEPTFESLGAHPDFALHAGQSIELHRPLEAPETVAISARVVAVHDKGRERGALIVVRQDIRRAADETPLATLTTTCFARDSGGCGSAGEPAPAAVSTPTRPPDYRAQYSVRPDAALLYRLTGDRNPLHASPAAALAAGFPRPILHGLCTFGMTCRAVLEHVAQWCPEHIASHSARFSAVVFPGDTLEVALWRDGQALSFEGRVDARDATVITGQALLR